MLVISEFYAKIIYDIHTIYIYSMYIIYYFYFTLDIYLKKKGEREKRRKKQILIYELI